MTSEGRSCIREVSKIIIGKNGRREEGITGRMDVQYKGCSEKANKIRPVCFGASQDRLYESAEILLHQNRGMN